ncbi:hypothetical protein CLOSCI_02317 [[Clostridium] scindens ATCC 35704]|nr:hypothetical protein CLOSCI_02317 [[Clostridium] scindens ATCC 35704]
MFIFLSPPIPLILITVCVYYIRPSLHHPSCCLTFTLHFPGHGNEACLLCYNQFIK